jgi:hypothetical protein
MRRWIALSLLGCILVGLNLVGRHQQRQDNLSWFVGVALAQGAVYLIAVWVVLRDGPAPRCLTIVLVFAALLRLAILFAPPYLSNDIYRYVWDGRVQAAGINPYRFVPADPALRSLRDGDIYPQINRRDYAHTIYPPLAQFLFLGITWISESVTWMKACMVGFEVVAVWMLLRLLALLGLPAERALIYVWHPLTVWEFAGSGHIDAAAIALLAAALWARQRNFPAFTGITLAAATLIKLYPVMLFPALYRRWDWKMPLAFLLTMVAGYIPYLSVGRGVFGFLPGYVQEEGLRSGWSIYLLGVIQRVAGEGTMSPVACLALALLAMLALTAWLVFWPKPGDTWPRNATILVTFFYVLVSPHYPWYFAWPLLLLTMVPYLPMLYLTVASFILYETLLGENAAVLFRLNTLLYVPFGLLVLVHMMAGRIRMRAKYSTGVGTSSGC